MAQKRLSIGEVAELLGRKPHTLRVWEYQNKLPKSLLPHRDERNWRYWTEKQVEGLREWIIKERIYPGKGLSTVKEKNY